MDTVISPSILSADFARLGEEVDAVMHAGAELIHFDVMDNHYVPNLTIGPTVCEALHRHSPDAMIDVHLMVSPVDRIVADFARAGATYISFHPEATEHVDRTIELIHDQGCSRRPGVQSGDAVAVAGLHDGQARHGAHHVRKPRLWWPEVHRPVAREARRPSRPH